MYWYQRQNDKQARDFAMKAMAVQPQDAELRNLLGNIYLRLGLTAKAIEEYSLASKLAPDRPDFREDLEKARKLISSPKTSQAVDPRLDHGVWRRRTSRLGARRRHRKRPVAR